MTCYLKLPVSFPSLQRVLAPMKLLVTLTKKVLSLQLFSCSFLQRPGGDQQTFRANIPTRALLYLIVLVSCSVQSEGAKKQGLLPYAMKEHTTAAMKEEVTKVSSVNSEGKQARNGSSQWARKRAGAQPGSDIGPQITKAPRSWCLLFHVQQIIFLSERHKICSSCARQSQKSQTFSCYQQSPVGSNSPDQPLPTPFDHWSRSLSSVQLSTLTSGLG